MIIELSDTDFSVLLADRNCVIVERRLGHRHLGKPLDGVMAILAGNIRNGTRAKTVTLYPAVTIMSLTLLRFRTACVHRRPDVGSIGESR